ncbi:hypothetical protein CK489_15330 [Bradyrhizobium sp. UFLA03-84]|uniref:hypothetical protein n=1 Tax=Bradyrhizobium sp. UFLA03-84 TaxID=418599 RepID=UPI000BAE30CA|nr:hypothetical protein [Bradyrhizobium sp. UFLA03-84]PAY07170.1 hypothetical protein CK489_15330 [Bradyrhizobium sp. UFLA03-84]
MTPDQFLERNPNWKQDASELCGLTVLRMIKDARLPTPWTDDTVTLIGDLATKMTLEIFEKHRDQMGDAVFGELVLFMGEEAKRYANLARHGTELAASRRETLQ